MCHMEAEPGDSGLAGSALPRPRTQLPFLLTPGHRDLLTGDSVPPQPWGPHSGLPARGSTFEHRTVIA